MEGTRALRSTVSTCALVGVEHESIAEDPTTNTVVGVKHESIAT